MGDHDDQAVAFLFADALILLSERMRARFDVDELREIVRNPNDFESMHIVERFDILNNVRDLRAIAA